MGIHLTKDELSVGVENSCSSAIPKQPKVDFNRGQQVMQLVAGCGSRGVPEK